MAPKLLLSGRVAGLAIARNKIWRGEGRMVTWHVIGSLWRLKVQRAGRWTCKRAVAGSTPGRGRDCVTMLDKSFTPMYLCHQAV